MSIQPNLEPNQQPNEVKEPLEPKVAQESYLQPKPFEEPTQGPNLKPSPERNLETTKPRANPT